MTKKMSSASKKKKEGQKRPCIPLWPTFPSMCHMLPLSRLIRPRTSGVAVTADAGMKCTRGQNFSSCWQLVFAVTAMGVGLEGMQMPCWPSGFITSSPRLVRHLGTCQRLYSICHKPRFSLRRIHSLGVIDWQVFVSCLTTLTPKVFQPISFS